MVAWMKEVPGRVWAWLGVSLGALVLLVGVYLTGRSRRKGDIGIALAEQALDVANRAYDKSLKQTNELHEKQKRIVADILVEQLARDAKTKQTKDLSNEAVLDKLRARGDIDPPPGH